MGWSGVYENQASEEGQSAVCLFRVNRKELSP